jgi:hypothetical protein
MTLTPFTTKLKTLQSNPCKYPFPLKSFHIWIFNNLF